MAIFTGTVKILGGTETVTQKKEFYYGLIQKNVLVTGANGQLGSELKALTKRMNVPFRFIFSDIDTLDILNEGQVIDFVLQHGVEYVINCAAYTAVEKAETDPDKAYEINCTGVENLAKAAKRHPLRIIHISTDYVFDGLAAMPYKETDHPQPLSVYGRTKLAGENILKQTTPDWITLRTSWLYSEYGSNFVKTMLRLMNERDELQVVDDQRGTPTYAGDLAEMIVHVLQFSEEKEWKPGLYHFSNSGETTWYGFAAKIKELSGNTSCVIHPVTTAEYKTEASRPAYSVLDKSKIKSAFQVVIPQWEDSLARCLKNLANQPE
ncbi:dTDP-4-dehydrorhamnose reductase [Limibacterium fermenti]|uniref:dTDP-4-dehydrorhamnose reductase n=1 Tax=Limibacterium fermenti TaxID=3229863 RepID=UPI000E7F76E5|nr:dTDP-4-dehydrorhamnose reductase [Porphyromonadaceae bacterium]